MKQTMKIMGVHRSLYYYHFNEKEREKLSIKKRGRPNPGYSVKTNGEFVSDEQIEEFIMEAMESEVGAYGYKKLTLFLRDEYHLKINPKKVYRLCNKLDVLTTRRTLPSPFPKRMAQPRSITGPNQLWQVDIKYGSLKESSRFFFLASAIDVFDRSIVGYYRGTSCKAENIKDMLQKAMFKRQVHMPNEENEYSIIIRSDNGPQFVSHTFGEFCSFNKIYHERIPPKSPNLNAYIESFHSILERECYQRYQMEFFEEAFYRIDEFIDFYNKRRYHGSLGFLSPKKYLERYKETGFLNEMIVNL
ncbi:IS3 family transposase [Sutcliffiella cohnii]|nr:IS3 family transposase [Sutcliffiella cohnii]